jgi:hypothetical protein
VNCTAYLVASFDVSGSAPVYLGADIFSEPTPTTRGRMLQVVLHSMEGKDFEEAWQRLVKLMLRTDVSGPQGFFRWLRPQIQAIVRRERAYRQRLKVQGLVVKTPKRTRKA